MSKFDNFTRSESSEDPEVFFSDLPEEGLTLTMDSVIVEDGDLCAWKTPTGKATFYFEALDDLTPYQDNAEIFLGVTINIKKINKNQFHPKSTIFYKAFNKESVFVERV